MAIHADELETILRAAFPDAEITVAGSDGVHMSAMVIDESFRR
jgi:acid stress-induced BolA-like protein IbaG/YrbA